MVAKKRQEKAPAKMLKVLLACPGLFGKSRGKPWKHARQKYMLKGEKREKRNRKHGERTKCMAKNARTHWKKAPGKARKYNHGKITTQHLTKIAREKSWTGKSVQEKAKEYLQKHQKYHQRNIKILKKYSDTSSINATICWGIMQSSLTPRCHTSQPNPWMHLMV